MHVFQQVAAGHNVGVSNKFQEGNKFCAAISEEYVEKRENWMFQKQKNCTGGVDNENEVHLHEAKGNSATLGFVHRQDLGRRSLRAAMSPKPFSDCVMPGRYAHVPRYWCQFGFC